MNADIRLIEQINLTSIMAGSGKISFRQGAKGYRHIGTYAKLLQRGMKLILPKTTIYVQLICSNIGTGFAAQT
jgi:hypothetical protein